MGMASVNQTRPHCVNQMGKTHSKPLAARHGRETAWARHAVYDSAFTGHLKSKKNVPQSLSYLRKCNISANFATVTVLLTKK